MSIDEFLTLSSKAGVGAVCIAVVYLLLTGRFRLGREFDSVASTIALMRGQIEAANTKYDALAIKYDALQAQNKSQQTKIDSLEVELATAKADRDTARAESAEFKRRLDALAPERRKVST